MTGQPARSHSCPCDTADVPYDLFTLGFQAATKLEHDPELLDVSLEDEVLAALKAVLPAHRAQVEREALAEQRTDIVKGIREYFAAADDQLYEDVRILCDRIERGEYGGRA